MNSKLFIFICALLCCLPSCTYYCGHDQLVRHFTAAPQTIPAVYDYSGSFSPTPDYDMHDPIIEAYAALPLPDGKVAGQTDAIRRVLAKLTQHKEVEQCNAFLMTLKPWSGHGTQWAFHPHGDYDFTEITFCSLLYLFADKPELLYPKTRDHIANVMIQNCGKKQALRMPGFMGIMRETENHILMGEVSRYLKNQWLHEHGDTSALYDNRRNGIESWMVKHLDEKFRGGFYEFNSDPYQGYSFQAIVTLFSFTHSDTVRHAANKLLNEIMYEYSLSSLNETRYTVFRRQTHRAGELPFDGDPLSSIVRVLVAQKTKEEFKVRSKGHGIITLLLSYRLNDALSDVLTDKRKNYFALLGHGRKGSPEIYTGGKGYVLSAGGLQRGKISQLASRPTMLLLDDGVGSRDSCFYVCSKGSMGQWNNTGLFFNFACADQPVHIPPQYTASIEKDGWKVYHTRRKQLSIFTYSGPDLGLLFVMETKLPDEVQLNNLIKANVGLDLSKCFMIPGKGKVYYDLHSPKNKWVITEANGQKTDRLYDKWQRLNITQ